MRRLQFQTMRVLRGGGRHARGLTRIERMVGRAVQLQGVLQDASGRRRRPQRTGGRGGTGAATQGERPAGGHSHAASERRAGRIHGVPRLRDGFGSGAWALGRGRDDRVHERERPRAAERPQGDRVSAAGCGVDRHQGSARSHAAAAGHVVRGGALVQGDVRSRGHGVGGGEVGLKCGRGARIGTAGRQRHEGGRCHCGGAGGSGESGTRWDDPRRQGGSPRAVVAATATRGVGHPTPQRRGGSDAGESRVLRRRRAGAGMAQVAHVGDEDPAAANSARMQVAAGVLARCAARRRQAARHRSGGGVGGGGGARAASGVCAVTQRDVVGTATAIYVYRADRGARGR